MCKKCVIISYEEILELIWQIELGMPIDIESGDFESRFEAYPLSTAALVIPAFDTAEEPPALGTGTLMPRELTWGFEESWKPGVIFNTRIESVSKPIWHDSMEHRRCIIPVTSFFETHKSEKILSPRTGKPIKRSYEFHVPGEDVILIGGIWKGERFSMVTTDANAFMSSIHPRMPLIVRQDELPIWLGPDYQQLADRSSIELVSQSANNQPSLF